MPFYKNITQRLYNKDGKAARNDLLFPTSGYGSLVAITANRKMLKINYEWSIILCNNEGRRTRRPSLLLYLFLEKSGARSFFVDARFFP